MKHTRIRIACATVPTLYAALLLALSTDATAAQNEGQEAGLARVECRQVQGKFVDHFRGAIIETGRGNRNFEIILTTAHGLPVTHADIRKQCRLIGDNGKGYTIREAWRPEWKSIEDDWAVLLTAGPLPPPVRRLQPLSIRNDQQFSEAMRIRLPLRFAGTEKPCALVGADTMNVEFGTRMFSHDCHAWKGHSGSPIIIEQDRDVSLVGIHIGDMQAYFPYRSVKIGRFIDERILAEIEAAVVAAGLETFRREQR